VIRWIGGIKYFLIIAGVLMVPASALALDNPEQKMASVIKNYIVKKNIYPALAKEDILITFKFAENTFDKLRNCSDKTSFRVLEVYPEFKPVGSAVFPIEVKDGDTKQKLWLQAKVEIIRKILAAARLIKKGKLLEAADFKLESRDIAMLPQKYYVEYSTLIGKEARIRIPANSSVFEWMVGDLPLIRRGSEVTILVSAPGMTLKANAEAMEDGYEKGVIKVRRKDSKKIIFATVISPSQVEVKVE